eukprot:637198-Alexandrium_andersonii.AAC.1
MPDVLRLRTPSILVVVVLVAERTPRELRGHISRPFVGSRSSGSERLTRCLHFLPPGRIAD